MTGPQEPEGAIGEDFKKLLKQLAVWSGWLVLIALGTVALIAVVFGLCMYGLSR